MIVLSITDCKNCPLISLMIGANYTVLLVVNACTAFSTTNVAHCARHTVSINAAAANMSTLELPNAPASFGAIDCVLQQS